MQNIDIAALKKFQAQWAPVLEAIPAVLEMAERKADLDRAMRVHEDAVLAARANAERETTAAAQAIAVAQQQFDALQMQVHQMQTAVGEKQREAKAVQEACAADIHKAQELAKVRVAEAERAAAVEVSRIRAAVAEQRKVAEQELEDARAAVLQMEERRAKTEKALDALRAKLG
jgi:hypothetical protein